MKPRLKSGLPVYFLEDGSARIGAQHEFRQQIADKKGNLRVLFEHLDGSLSSKEIVDSISNILGIPASEAENALTFLNNAGVLEDAEIYEDILPSLQVNHRFFQIVSPDLQSPITHAQKLFPQKPSLCLVWEVEVRLFLPHFVAWVSKSCAYVITTLWMKVTLIDNLFLKKAM